jgi:hypothetical protein
MVASNHLHCISKKKVMLKDGFLEGLIVLYSEFELKEFRTIKRDTKFTFQELNKVL